MDALEDKANTYYGKKIVKYNFKLLRQYTELKSKRHNRYNIDNDFAIQCLFTLINHSFQIKHNVNLKNSAIIKKISNVLN